jgi:hypothetical protein
MAEAWIQLKNHLELGSRMKAPKEERFCLELARGIFDVAIWIETRWIITDLFVAFDTTRLT